VSVSQMMSWFDAQAVGCDQRACERRPTNYLRMFIDEAGSAMKVAEVRPLFSFFWISSGPVAQKTSQPLAVANLATQMIYGSDLV
jgi:hypothetical protein